MFSSIFMLSRTVSFMQTPCESSSRTLSSWGLPAEVVNCYAANGITELFQWQAECLSLKGVLSGSNIVYSAPTSAGKTLVAELLALKCVIEQQKKVLFVLPFISVAQEKVAHFKTMFASIGVKIGGFMGGRSPQGGLTSVDIAICTIEKANSIVNHLLEEGMETFLGAVIVDELHLLGDVHRGYLLELLLAKLLYFTSRSYKKTCVSHYLQVVGMSALLPNLKTIAKWLNAIPYSTTFRPVPLSELIMVDKILYDSAFHTIIKDYNSVSTVDDGATIICLEALKERNSILMFCPTKAWCEEAAVSIASHIKLFLDDPNIVLDKAGLDNIVKQLSCTQAGLDSVLENTLSSGVAFHHAGLTLDEREIIESAFRSSLIHVLVATSTLSAGVNLPARYVIISTPVFHGSALDTLIYKQMIGRAGRKGIDIQGDGIIICKSHDKKKALSIIESQPKPVCSCLVPKMGNKVSSLLKRALLEIVASAHTVSFQELMLFFSCTLLYAELQDGKKKFHIYH